MPALLPLIDIDIMHAPAPLPRSAYVGIAAAVTLYHASAGGD